MIQTMQFNSLPSELSELTWKRFKIRVSKMNGFHFREGSDDIEVSLYHSLWIVLEAIGQDHSYRDDHGGYF